MKLTRCLGSGELVPEKPLKRDYVMCKPYKCCIHCRQYIRQEMAVEIACLASSEGLFSGLYLYLGLVLLRKGFVKSILGPVLPRIGLQARTRP